MTTAFGQPKANMYRGVPVLCDDTKCAALKHHAAGRLMADIPIIIIIGQRVNTQTRLVHISLLQFFIVFCSGNRLSCNDTLWLEELKACLGIFFGCFFMSRIYSDPIAGRTDRRREPTRQCPLPQRIRVLRIAR